MSSHKQQVTGLSLLLLLGRGIANSLDSRKNKHYPQDAYWVDINGALFAMI